MKGIITQRNKEKEICYPLVHSPNGHEGWSRASLELDLLGAQSLESLPGLPRGFRGLDPWAFLHCLFGHTIRELNEKWSS